MPFARLTGTAVAAAVAVTALTGAASAPATARAEASAATVRAAASPAAIAAAALAKMSLSQRVGQLFMVGGDADGVPSATRRAITTYHVGNVMLTGRSTKGVTATARITAALKKLTTSSATARVPLVIATDQEGGLVQVLRGQGFSTIPKATTQGTFSPAYLRKQATRWGTQLHDAGLSANLAPVADTVPSASFAPHNDPIGYFHREYGYTPAAVGAHVLAFLRGMGAAHVLATVKHFPGIGRVTANTDTTSHVTDSTTTRHDAYLGPFRDAIDAGVPMVMMSTVIYTRIDAKHPAAFSRTVVTGMLRGDLGFHGVVISDDLAKAKQVAAYSYGTRAIDVISAGGDVVLTVLPGTLPAMYRAVLGKARSDAAFAKLVNAAALRVLTMKAQLGLLR